MISVRGIWGLISGAFTLILVYLLLTNSRGFTRVINAVFDGSVRAGRTLQGR